MPNLASLDLESTSSQYASAVDSASLSITGDLTIEAWLKPESAVSADPISKWNDVGTAQRAYEITIAAATMKFNLAVSSTGTNVTGGGTLSTGTLQVGAWTHVAAAYVASAGTVQYYHNGTTSGNEGGLATSIFNSTGNLMVGAQDSGSPQRFYDGLIDEVRIWNVTRTAQQILDNYQVELAGTETGLAAYWRLNNGYTDETVNANTLTASGAPVFSTDVPFTGGGGLDLTSKIW